MVTRKLVERIRMALEPAIPVGEFDALRRLDTCTVSNAIETFQLRLRNAGFADSRVRCIFEDFPPLVGYAATGLLRTGEPPIAGVIHDRHDWWNSILQVPEPRMVVLQDLDDPPGVGAYVGELHAAILRALGCVGYVTNGAVRELPRVKDSGLHLFAGNVAVSHAYPHIFDFGSNVTVGGLEVKPGDLMHGDRHGILTVPREIASEIPAVAARLRREEKEVIDLCRSPEFSVDKLRQVVKGLR
jgi:4-hydroxy-4-methyl-2-oxoglutarate aldolase